MGRVWLVVFIGLLAAACSGGAANTTTTAVAPATTAAAPVSTTSTTEATTTTAVEHVELCVSGRTILWKPGVTYVADCFFVPVSFLPVAPGWRTPRIEDDRFVVTLVDGGEPVAELAVLGYRPSSGLDIVVDSILELEGLTLVSDQVRGRVGGWPAISFDVQSGSDRSLVWDECHSLSLGTVIDPASGPGWSLLYGGLDGTDSYGFSPCRTFRVWAVDVSGDVVTLIAAADEEKILQDWMPAIERLVESITFEAD